MANSDIGIRITAQDATAAGVRSAMAGLQGLQGAAGGVNRALASIGVGLSAGAFVAYTKSIIDGIDALNDLKDATGASIENISALEDVARRSGAGLDTVSTSLVKLNQALASAKPGSPAEAAIKAIGLSVKDLKALDPAEAFRRIAVGLDGYADDANKARLTQELFGKSLREVAPLLKDLATQGALNATVTTAQAEEAEKFNKQMFALQKNVTDASRSLVSDMVPALNAVFAAMQNGGLMKGLDELGNQLFDWEGNNARKEIRYLTAELESLHEQQALITLDIFGNKGAIQADIEAKINALKAAKDAYFKLTNGSAGGGRGSVNPAFVDGRNSAADIGSGDSKKLAGISAAQKLVNDGLALYNDLMAEAAGYSKTYTEDITKLAAAYQATSMTAEQYATALAAINAAQPGAVQAEKDRIEAAKLNTQAVDDLFDAQEKLRLANEEQIKTGRTMLEQIEYETLLLGLNAEQRAMAALERELETQGIVKGTQAYDAYIVKLREATAIKTAKEAGIKSTEELAEANKKAAEESSKYWEDALMRAFESGKGFFESLWSTIKNTLKTQVLKVLVTGTLSGLGLSGAAAAGGGGSGVLDLVNGAANLNTLYGAGSQYLFGGTAGASSASLLAGNAAGMVGGDALGTMIAANGNWAGVATAASESAAAWASAAAIEGNALVAIEAGATAAEAAAAASAAGAAGGAGSSAAAGLGATGYGLIAAAAIAAIMYITSRGETRLGATYTTGADGLAMVAEGPSGGEIAADAARAIFNSTQASINATLAAVGSKAAITGFTAGLESSENGKGFAFAGGMVNGVGVGEYKGRNGGQFAMSDMTPQQAMEAYVTQMNQVTLEALQAATDVPALIANELKGIDIGKLTSAEVGELTKTVQTVIASVNVFNASLKTLPFESLWDLSFKATAELINMAGGIETLSTNLAGYYDNFYSESEKTANLTRVLGDNFAALGQTMPTDNLRDWYRTQVEAAMAADQSVPANAALTASLLAMQGGVNTLAKTSEDAARAALDAAAAQKKQTQENIAATLGFDASGLSDMIMNAALNPAAGMSAAESFAATLEETIKNQLISNTVSSISQSIFDSIITPMMLGQAVSDATLDEITAAATARLDALDALFNSTEFQTGLQNILTSVSTTVAGLGGFGGSASGSAADQPFVQYMDNVVAAIDPIAEALKSVVDRIAALQPKDTAATRAAEIAKALADFGTDGTWIDTLIPGGGKGGTDIWVKEFIASNENAVTRALTELYKLEDQRKAQDSARSIIAIQSELAKYLGDASMASGVMRWNRADTLAKLNEQDPSGALAGEQQKLWDAKNISDFNRALLEASGDTAGLAAFDRAASDIALVLDGWSQDQINALNAQIDLAEATAKATELASINTGWQDKIDLLTGATTDRQLQHTRDLADATDATTKALIEQYYAQLDIADATTTQTSLLDRYKPKMDLGGAWDAVLDAGIDRRGTGKMSADGIRQWFADMIAAADPLTTEGQATIETLSGLAGAIDVIAQSATDAATKAADLAKTNQGYQDQIDVLSGTRTQVQVDRENALAAATDASTKALMLRLYALQDEAEAAAKAAELLKINAGWQSQLDVLLGNKTQKEVDRAAALAEVTDESTRALMLQVYAQQDMAEAATASIDAMQALSAELDQIADFRGTIGDAQQNIRSQMTGYDAVAYGKSQVEKYTAQLAGATTTQGRIDAGAGLRDAIAGRYDAELALINKNRDAAEQSAREAFDAQTQADNAAIQSANQINAAYRQIGEYVKGLVTGADAPYSLASRYAAAQADYSTTLALAQAGDKDALSRITGAQGNLLSTAREQSVSSVDYARTFGRTINELSALAAKAGPDLESVTRQFYFDSSAFDQQALDLQTSAITELEDLATLTDEWTAELQNQMAEQALTFANIGLNTQQTADYTSKIEPGFERVAVAIDSAIQAQNAQAALLAEIQGLRQEVAGLRRATDAVGVNTKATADTLDSVSGGGGPLLVQTA